VQRIVPKLARRRTWWQSVAQVAALVALTAVLALLIARGEAMLRFYRDREAVASFVRAWGPWMPVGTVTLHVVQILLAPLPGQVLDAVNGYLFGPWLGTLLSMVGVGSGSTLAMTLARRFGRPLVERFVDRRVLGRLDERVRRHGRILVFLIFLFPFLPDDAVCFVAGLTLVPLPELALLAVVGRLPGVFVANCVGYRAARLSPGELGALLAGLLIAGLAIWRYRRAVEGALLCASERLADLASRRSRDRRRRG